MHIPDGYLSPATCAVGLAVMVPTWAVASVRVQRVVKTQYAPLLAVGAAFSFLIMMFNIPVPDGTTAHATGAALVAILLGPWAAVISVSVALLIQALFFGDGGLLAFPVNALNIAVVAPFVAYAVYRIVARGSALTSGRRALAAGIGAFVGINAAALAAAVEFGIQPALFTAADGTPLYAPFDLTQTIPAMAFAHVLIAGPVEFAVTAGVLAYLQQANVPLLRLNAPDVPLTDAERRRVPRSPARTAWRASLVAMAIMVALTPLGLLATGTAFGEDAPEELDLAAHGLTAIPNGLAEYSGFWQHSLFGDYGFADGEHPVLGYLLSAVVGILAVGAVIFAAVWLLRRGGGPVAGTGTTSTGTTSTGTTSTGTTSTGATSVATDRPMSAAKASLADPTDRPGPADKPMAAAQASPADPPTRPGSG